MIKNSRCIGAMILEVFSPHVKNSLSGSSFLQPAVGQLRSYAFFAFVDHKVKFTALCSTQSQFEPHQITSIRKGHVCRGIRRDVVVHKYDDKDDGEDFAC